MIKKIFIYVVETPRVDKPGDESDIAWHYQADSGARVSSQEETETAGPITLK